MVLNSVCKDKFSNYLFNEEDMKTISTFRNLSGQLIYMFYVILCHANRLGLLNINIDEFI